MLLNFVHANGIRFDIGLQPGMVHLRGQDMPGAKLDFSLLALNLGYRWVFKNKMFLDWDFLSGPSNSFASFKVGKLLQNNKLAVYGILTPFAVPSALVKIKKLNSVVGIGTNAGAGVSYKVAKNVSLFGEVRGLMFLPVAYAPLMKFSDFKKIDNPKLSFGVRAMLGVSFHPAALNG